MLYLARRFRCRFAPAGIALQRHGRIHRGVPDPDRRSLPARFGSSPKVRPSGPRSPLWRVHMGERAALRSLDSRGSAHTQRPSWALCEQANWTSVLRDRWTKARTVTNHGSSNRLACLEAGGHLLPAPQEVYAQWRGFLAFLRGFRFARASIRASHAGRTRLTPSEWEHRADRATVLLARYGPSRGRSRRLVDYLRAYENEVVRVELGVRANDLEDRDRQIVTAATRNSPLVAT